MRWMVIAFLFMVFMQAEAQHFNWASTGMGLATGVHSSAYSRRGELLIAMDYSKPSYYPFDSRIVMYSNADDSLDLGYFMNEFLFVAYDVKGHFIYNKKGSDFGEHFDLFGIAALSTGNFVLAYRALKIPGDVPIYEKDGTISNKKMIPSWVSRDALSKNINFDGTHTYTGDAMLFTVLSPQGEVIDTHAMIGFDRYIWKSFSGTLDGGLMIGLSEHRLEKTEFGYSSWVQYDCVIKLKSDLHIAWSHDTKEICETSNGSYIPGMRSVASDDNQYFSVGTMHGKIHAEGSPVHEVQGRCETISEKEDPGYEAYVNCISEDGNLLWVKFSGSPVIFDDVTAARNHIFISGRLICSDRVFGNVVDTTSEKKTFIVCLDYTGNVRWINTYHARQICRLDADESGKMNAFFHTMDVEGDLPLVIGQDTLQGFYCQIIVASFSENGNALWTKTSNVPMSSNGVEETQLYHDGCGNVFVVGSMWFVGSAGFSCFDAAFVNGQGYAGAPLVAMIQTTIPPENLALFAHHDEASKNFNFTVEVSNDEEKSMAEVNEIEEQCIPISKPWRITVMPNPTDGKYAAKIELSYAAKNVNVDVYTTMGSHIKNIFRSDILDEQTLMLEDDISELPAGAYLLIVQGEGGAASARFIKTK